MQINHNSTLARYKSKLGALKTGEATQIYVFAQDVCNVKIKIECEGQLLIHDMSNCDGCWSYEFVAPPTPCVVFYTFSFSANNHDYILCAANSTGQADSVILPENAEDNLINPFQITIYDKDFITPDWVKNGVMYQIFPDRFCRGNKTNLINGKKYHEQLGRTIIAHENWDEEPICTPINGNEDYFPCDFFGGDLIGIEQQLDYLQSLSVTVIYLNPICEASSNHRYDTANYMKVDPILGSNYDFSHLCDSAAARGIKIIIDGVFSHTGSDSVYFNKNANYSNKGAYQGEDSPFYSWYKFHDSADDYESWWGFKTLPEVEEQNKDWQKYIITSKNGVFYN
ncbi:MAG: alpha-amylase family glycosyl hydrolase, partial [Oscillospiraceae bacterium]